MSWSISLKQTSLDLIFHVPPPFLRNALESFPLSDPEPTGAFLLLNLILSLQWVFAAVGLCYESYNSFWSITRVWGLSHSKQKHFRFIVFLETFCIISHHLSTLDIPQIILVHVEKFTFFHCIKHCACL